MVTGNDGYCAVSTKLFSYLFQLKLGSRPMTELTIPQVCERFQHTHTRPGTPVGTECGNRQTQVQHQTHTHTQKTQTFRRP